MSIVDLIVANRMVVAAYAVAIVLIGGYALSVVLRRRSTARQLEAWSEVGGGSAAPERDE